MVSWKSITGKEKSSKKEKTAGNIDFERENMVKCLCSQCKVQKDSQCAHDKMLMLQISMRGMSPEPSEFPGMYCANGKATCDDLDPNKQCKCPDCEVWKEHELNSKQVNSYFCQNGNAE